MSKIHVHFYHEKESEKKAIQVVDFLNSIKGSVFVFHPSCLSPTTCSLPEDFTEPVTQERFLSHLDAIRMSEGLKYIKNNNPYVLFLNNRCVANNHFNEIDFGKFNIMVDVEGYSRILPGIPSYLGISYIVIASLLKHSFFKDEETAINALHIERTIGCVLDFNGNKRNLGTTIHAAHICPTCVKTISKNVNDPILLRFFSSALERIRQDVIASEMRNQISIPKISVQLIENRRRGVRSFYKIIVANYFELDFKPVQLAIFLYFLYLRRFDSQRGGARIIEVHQANEILRKIYMKVQSRPDGNWVNEFCTTEQGSIFQSYLSGMNKVIETTLGDYGLEEIFKVFKRVNTDVYSLDRKVKFVQNKELIDFLEMIKSALEQEQGEKV